MLVASEKSRLADRLAEDVLLSYINAHRPRLDVAEDVFIRLRDEILYTAIIEAFERIDRETVL